MLIRAYLIASIILGLGFGFTACKKYPEDGHFSWQMAKKRLRGHTWYMSKLYVNGADSTLVHLQQMDPSHTNPSDFSFHLVEGMNYHTNHSKLVTTNVLKNKGADFDIDDKKQTLQITGNELGFISLGRIRSIFWSNSSKLWIIKKLTKTEFIMETTTTDNQLIRFEFKSTY